MNSRLSVYSCRYRTGEENICVHFKFSQGVLSGHFPNLFDTVGQGITIRDQFCYSPLDLKDDNQNAKGKLYFIAPCLCCIGVALEFLLLPGISLTVSRQCVTPHVMSNDLLFFPVHT